ncbi:MAG: hypothetical protein WBV82_28940 [Myxococcaceae bacterium]
MRISVVASLLLSIVSPACSRADEAGSAVLSSAKQPAAMAAPDPSEAAQSKKPLSHYLAQAVRVKVHEMKMNPAGGSRKVLTRTLSEDETRAYLGRIDLNQLADGPLVRCPSTESLDFEDATGTLLGSISFCNEHARFDAPDKSFGGIKAPKP